MNVSDFNDAVKSFDIATYKEQFKLIEDRRKNFVERFPISRILKLSLDEYVQGKGIREDNFCYELEWELGSLGRIVGSPVNKFGIYYSRKYNQYRPTKQWQRDTIQQSIKDLRVALAALIEAGKNGDLENIRVAPFSPMFKGKILSTYYPEKHLPVFSEEHLNYFIHRLELDHLLSSNSDVFDKRNILINFKNNNPIMRKWPLHAFAHFLYIGYPKAPKKDEETPNFIENIEFIEGDFSTLDDDISAKGGKTDFDAVSKNKAALGERGEYIVCLYEAKKLKAEKIRKRPVQVSLKDDSLGYDILSYDVNGDPLYIEVKSTNSSPKDFRFYFSANELKTALTLGKEYHVYIVFKPNSSRPKIFDLGNPFLEDGKITLIPVSYKIHLGKI